MYVRGRDDFPEALAYLKLKVINSLSMGTNNSMGEIWHLIGMLHERSLLDGLSNNPKLRCIKCTTALVMKDPPGGAS